MKVKDLFLFIICLLSPLSFSQADDFWIPEQENFFEPNTKKIFYIINRNDNLISLKDLKKLFSSLTNESCLRARTKGFRTNLNWIDLDGFHERGEKMSCEELVPYLQDGFCQSILLQVYDPSPQDKIKQLLLKKKSLRIFLQHHYPNKDFNKDISYQNLTKEIKLFQKKINSGSAFFPYEKQFLNFSILKEALSKNYNNARVDNSLATIFHFKEGLLIKQLLKNSNFIKLGTLYLKIKISEEKSINALQKDKTAHLRDILATGLTAWLNYTLASSLKVQREFSLDVSLTKRKSLMEKIIVHSCPRGYAALITKGSELLKSLKEL